MRKSSVAALILICAIVLSCVPTAFAYEAEYELRVSFDADCQAFELYIAVPADIAGYSFVRNDALFNEIGLLKLESKEIGGKLWIYALAQEDIFGAAPLVLGTFKIDSAQMLTAPIEIGAVSAFSTSGKAVAGSAELSAPADSGEPKLPEVTIPESEPPEWLPDLPDTQYEAPKYEREPEEVSGSVFTDIDESHWAYEAMAILAEITSLFPKGGKARPGDAITRAEFAHLNCVLFGIPLPEYLEIFSDVAEDTPYAREINTLAEIGIVSGVGEGKFSPDGNINRESAALMLFKLIGNQKRERTIDFTDSGKISLWAKTAVQHLGDCGIISGDEYYRFNPQNELTRADAAVLTLRAALKAAEQLSLDY
ncbi:MAG: S-layer homology domain-containing protein [Oscillospiraceae bacterium]|jgi:hypothetical protein|nr:S-layer homology domain-containing protein [Oscillospiraceae bacterium]